MPQSISELNSHFAVRDHLTYVEDEPGMVKMRITTASADATIYLQGAHLSQWTPRGASPVIYMSPKSALEPGKPIRGGIPVLFPWFGPRWNAEEFDGAHGTTSPMHGYGRVTVWTVDRVHLSPDGDVHITFSLPPNADAAAFGYPDLPATLELQIGAELHMTLSVTNRGSEPVLFEEGFHTYFAVADVPAVRLDGLRGSTFVDKRDSFTRKVQRESQFSFTRDVDQVHVHTSEPLSLQDPAGHRAIGITKTGSQTTVVWNPSSVVKMPDLADDSWQHFVCVEVVNAMDDRITLRPGATHGMAMKLTVNAL